MQSLPRPTDTTLTVFRACVGSIGKRTLRNKFAKIEQEIESASTAYEQLAEISELYTIPSTKGVGKISAKQMSGLYNGQMLRKDTPGRFFYEKILASAPYETCPLCVHRSVSTLDHHLGKMEHPVFAVTPFNLIPSCWECNKAKSHHFPKTVGEQTLHPYFDDIRTIPWLTADVQHTVPAALLYRVADPAGLDPVLRERIQQHFDLLGLANLYGTQAAKEMVNIRGLLRTTHHADGAMGVKNHLERMAQSCSGPDLNSWQSVMYRILSDSDWFCDNNFG